MRAPEHKVRMLRCWNQLCVAMLLFAHRGLSARYPENTLPSFLAARQEGCQAIELDVQISRDGVLFVFHDDDLWRITGHQGLACDRTYTELRALDAGAWFDPRFRGTRIPTLDEVLDVWAGAGLVNLELKSARAALRKPLAHQVVALLERRSDNVIVSSFDWELLTLFHDASPSTPLAVLFDNDRWDHALAIASTLGARAVNPHVRTTSADRVASARKRGFDVFVYTVNDTTLARTLAHAGVTGLFTDDASAMRRALEQTA